MPTAWYINMDIRAKYALWLAFCAWAADAMNIHMVILATPGIMEGLHLSPDDEIEYIVSSTLWASAGGGWFFGLLSDQIGRARTLRITIAWVAVFTFLCAFARTYDELLFLHTVLGFGFGGVWTASAVLVGEWASPAHRGKTVGLMQSGWAVGWGMALALKWLLLNVFALPQDVAWRWMFGIGLAPVMLVYVLWRFVDDAPVFIETRPAGMKMSVLAAIGARLAHFLGNFANLVTNLRADFFRNVDAIRRWAWTLVLGAPETPRSARRWWVTFVLSIGAQAGYYAITLGLPGFLAEKGHAVVLEDGYLVIFIIGSLMGYLTGAWASDRFDRHPVLVAFALGATVTVGFCTLLPLNTVWVLVLALPLGFFASGVFSGIGAFLTELYPTPTRGRRQGSSYSFGRRVAAYILWPIGLLNAHLHAPGPSIFFVVGIAYVCVIAAALWLPETNGRVLTAEAE
jgi:MFS family permease